ncbi:MAG: hypothetical protein P4L56_23950 [Candidatus Sulfopaludibacter sp.]|nr:hypothetical protein [Candidatus Sulfopaludibacter sp.]
MDTSILFGPTWYRPHTIPGTNVALSGSTGYSQQISYGYQVLRTPAGNLWIELNPMTFFSPGASTANIKGSFSPGGFLITPGVRYMVPVQSRLSLYAVAGGGVGTFDYPVVGAGDTPYVATNDTWHGVFEFGGGIDIRLIRFLSVRAECRDFVTGKGLDGVPGRHHLAPAIGIATHF